MTEKKGFPVIRIIDGVAYEGKSGSKFRVRAYVMGDHVEVSAVRNTEWTELDLSPTAMEHLLDAIQRNKDETADERALLKLKIAANRAKTRVRRLCKMMGADTLLTLTYRANMQDLDTAKAHLKAFNRRMEAIHPDFRFVAAFEKQERGAWHIHIATAGLPQSFTVTTATGQKVKLKSFNMIRALWRRTTGDLGGNIDVSRRKARSRDTAAKIAAYLSKYVTKDFATVAAGKNRYASYGTVKVIESTDMGYVDSVLEAVEVCYSLIGHRAVFDQHLSRWADWFFLHAESPAATKNPLGRG
jgi:hypothetical protein